MIEPIRCFTCGKVINSACRQYNEYFSKKISLFRASNNKRELMRIFNEKEQEILQTYGIKRNCCVRMVKTQPTELYNITSMYDPTNNMGNLSLNDEETCESNYVSCGSVINVSTIGKLDQHPEQSDIFFDNRTEKFRQENTTFSNDEDSEVILKEKKPEINNQVGDFGPYDYLKEHNKESVKKVNIHKIN